MSILDQIIADKREEVNRRLAELPLDAMRSLAASRPDPVSFSAGFRDADPLALIAEVKHRSPSAGVIRDPFEPAAIAAAYQRAGAHAVSVLMDEKYFGGGEDHFRQVREAVTLPMLYKEFVVDPWQVWHARHLGASVVLLIAAALPEGVLSDLMAEAATAGLEVLFEVHDAAELECAVRLGASIIGINNRNLKTFETRLEHTLDLVDRVPEEALLISESGIRTHTDVTRLAGAGVHGILVGEHLLRKPELDTAVRGLLHG